MEELDIKTLVETNRRLNRRCQRYEKRVSKYRRRLASAMYAFNWTQRQVDGHAQVLRSYRREARKNWHKSRDWNLLLCGLVAGFIAALVLIGIWT